MPKCYGTASVGRQGQIVIPAEARRDMGLDTHDKLLVFGAAHGRALFLVKVDQFEQMMSAWSQKIVSLEQQARASYARVEGADDCTGGNGDDDEKEDDAGDRDGVAETTAEAAARKNAGTEPRTE